MKKFFHFLSYLVLRSVCLVLMLLPLQLVYLLARGAAHLGFHVFRFRRQVVMDNLHIAFGGKIGHAGLEALASRAYVQIAMTFMELMIMPKLYDQGQNTPTPEHLALLQRLLHEGRGLVLVSGHLGNWELQGAVIAKAMPGTFSVAAVQQSNPYINRFITQRRNDTGMQVAASKEAMRLLLKALKNKEAIGLVADQNAGRDAVFVDFFGKIAATAPGPAQLALKYGAPMVFGAAVRIAPGKFKTLVQQVAIKKDDTVQTLTQKHVKILEGFIRQYPDQYFWLHRRWKTRPPEELKI